jgi:hypothetical protein
MNILHPQRFGSNGLADPIVAGREGCTETTKRDRFHLPQASPKVSSNSSWWVSWRIYWTCTSESSGREKEDFGRGNCEQVSGRKVFILG